MQELCLECTRQHILWNVEFNQEYKGIMKRFGPKVKG
jgi:hypothetical protein